MTESEKNIIAELDKTMSLIAQNLERNTNDTKGLLEAHKLMAEETKEILKSLSVSIEGNKGLTKRVIEHGHRVDRLYEKVIEVEKESAVLSLKVENSKSFNTKVISALTTLFIGSMAYIFKTISGG